MKIASGTTDQYIYFVAVDSTDYVTRETGLSGFTVYRSRNGAAAAAMTTPTVNEVDSTNMPGVYELLLDEDTTIAAGNDTEEMVFHITKTGMAPVTRTIELFRPKITEGYTLGVNSSGHVSRLTLCDTTTTNTDQRGTDNAFLAASAPSNFSSLGINASGHVSRITLCDTTTTNTDMRGTDSAFLAASAPSNFSSLGINASGHISRVTLCDTTTTNTDAITVAAVADGVWDESLSAHTSAGSTGKALKQIKEGIITIDGSVNDASATTTTFVTNLSSAVDGYYHDKVIVFISGSLSGQARHIETYTGATKSITVSQAFTSAPANSDEFLILATHEHSLGEIADAVWDEAIAGHAAAGSTGATLSSAGTAGDPWTTEIPGSYTAGQAGYVLGTTVINKLTNDAIVYVNPSTQYDLELIRSDAYDGTSHDKLSFPAGKSIAGVTCVLTVRNADTDASLMSVSGVGVGSNAEITLTSAQTASLVPGIQKFDVEVQHSGTSKQTIARGECIVLEDQTR